jgi:hypothetical protein
MFKEANSWKEISRKQKILNGKKVNIVNIKGGGT